MGRHTKEGQARAESSNSQASKVAKIGFRLGSTKSSTICSNTIE